MRIRTRWSSPAPLLADKTQALPRHTAPLGLALEFLGAAIRGGVDVVQIRDRGVPDGRLLEVLTRAGGLAGALRVPLVVNDRPDLAVLAGRTSCISARTTSPWTPPAASGFAVGLSTHTPGEIDEAAGDYIGVGPVYATPTKEGPLPVGLDLVRYAAEHARVPWFAIGGIDATNVEEVVAAGARRIAVVRAIGDAADPERAARSYAPPYRPSRVADQDPVDREDAGGPLRIPGGCEDEVVHTRLASDERVSPAMRSGPLVVRSLYDRLGWNREDQFAAVGVGQRAADDRARPDLHRPVGDLEDRALAQGQEEVVAARRGGDRGGALPRAGTDTG